MSLLTDTQQRYPDAPAWSFGDSPEMGNELAELIIQGKKQASCGSFAGFSQEQSPPRIGSYSIVLDGQQQPVAVIRLMALRLIRFCDMTQSLAEKEGEGDLSLAYWQQSHKAFFEREGYFSEDMELVFEEFILVEIL